MKREMDMKTGNVRELYEKCARNVKEMCVKC